MTSADGRRDYWESLDDSLKSISCSRLGGSTFLATLGSTTYLWPPRSVPFPFAADHAHHPVPTRARYDRVQRFHRSITHRPTTRLREGRADADVEHRTARRQRYPFRHLALGLDALLVSRLTAGRPRVRARRSGREHTATALRSSQARERAHAHGSREEVVRGREASLSDLHAPRRRQDAPLQERRSVHRVRSHALRVRAEHVQTAIGRGGAVARLAVGRVREGPQHLDEAVSYTHLTLPTSDLV